MPSFSETLTRVLSRLQPILIYCRTIAYCDTYVGDPTRAPVFITYCKTCRVIDPPPDQLTVLLLCFVSAKTYVSALTLAHFDCVFLEAEEFGQNWLQ